MSISISLGGAHAGRMRSIMVALVALAACGSEVTIGEGVQVRGTPSGGGGAGLVTATDGGAATVEMKSTDGGGGGTGGEGGHGGAAVEPACETDDDCGACERCGWPLATACLPIDDCAER